MLQQVELYIQAAERELQSATASITQFNHTANNIEATSTSTTETKISSSSVQQTKASLLRQQRNITSASASPVSSAAAQRTSSSSSAAASSLLAKDAVSFTKKAIGLVKEAIQSFVDDVQNWKHDNNMIRTSPERRKSSATSSPSISVHHHHQYHDTKKMPFQNTSSRKLLNMSSATASTHPLATSAHHHPQNINTSLTVVSPLSSQLNDNINNSSNVINKNTDTSASFSSMHQLTSDLQRLHESYQQQREQLVSLRAVHRWSLGMYRKQYEYATITMNRRQAALENVVDHSAALGEQFALRRQLTHAFFSWCTWAVNKRRRRDQQTRRSLSPPSVATAATFEGDADDDEYNNQEHSQNRKQRLLVSPSPSLNNTDTSSSSNLVGDYFELWISNATEIFSSYSLEKALLVSDQHQLMVNNINNNNNTSPSSVSSVLHQHHSASRNRVITTTTATTHHQQHNHQQSTNNNSITNHLSFAEYFSSLDAQRLNAFAVQALLQAHESVRTNLLQCAATTTSCNYMMFTRTLFWDDDEVFDDNDDTSNDQGNHTGNRSATTTLVDSSRNPAFGHVVRNLQRSNSNNANNNETNNNMNNNLQLNQEDPLHQAYMNLLRHNYRLRKDMRTLEGVNTGLLSELQSLTREKLLLRKKFVEIEELMQIIEHQNSRMREHSVLAFLLSSSSVSAFVEADEAKMKLWLEHCEKLQVEKWRNQEEQLSHLQEEMLLASTVERNSASEKRQSPNKKKTNQNSNSNNETNDSSLDELASSDPRRFWSSIINNGDEDNGTSSCTKLLLPFFRCHLDWKNSLIDKVLTERDEAKDSADVAWSRLENLTKKHAEVMAQVRSLEKQNQIMKKDASMYRDLDRMSAAQNDGYSNNNDYSSASSSLSRQRNNNNNTRTQTVEHHSASPTNIRNLIKSLFPSNTKNLNQDEIDEIVRARCFRRWSTYAAARLRQRVYEASVERSKFLTASVNDKKLREMMLYDDDDYDLDDFEKEDKKNQEEDEQQVRDRSRQYWAREANSVVPGASTEPQESPIRQTLSEARTRNTTRDDDDDSVPDTPSKYI